MNKIKRFFLWIRTLLNRQEKILKIEGKKDVGQTNKRLEFKDSIKVDIQKSKSNKKIRTPICDGDGLGIKKGLFG